VGNGRALPSHEFLFAAGGGHSPAWQGYTTPPLSSLCERCLARHRYRTYGPECESDDEQLGLALIRQYAPLAYLPRRKQAVGSLLGQA
jgi:hypothetical protein